MITEALRHFPGIGPVRLARLQDQGTRSWHDIVSAAGRHAEAWVLEARRCLEALAQNDIPFFVDRLDRCDKWRILHHFFEQTSYFDIETMGLEQDASITVIICWHRGRLHTFVEHENLDDFLALLDDVSLLASFNGSAFDVPRLEQTFHIPQLPCPHLDFRWICYHHGLRGSLKEIARRMEIHRPADLSDADGVLAVHWWQRWRNEQDRAARDQLVRYCSADVLMLVALAHQLTGREFHDVWTQLPPPHQPYAEMPDAPVKGMQSSIMRRFVRWREGRMRA